MNIPVINFNTGEVTKKIDARSDVEKYLSSCRVMENMLPLIYGAAVRRPGTEYIATSKYTDKPIRLIPFIYSAEIAYVCEFGDQYIRFYYDGEQLLDGAGDPVEVVTPYLVADLEALQTRQIGDTMWVVHPSYGPRKLTRTTATSFSLDEIVFEKGPFLLRNDLLNDDDVTMTPSVYLAEATGTLTASAATFVSGHVGALWKLTQPRVLVQTTLTKTTTQTGEGTPAGGIPVKGTFTFTTHGTWDATIEIQRNEDSAGWETFRTYSGVNDRNIQLSAVENDDNVYYRVNVTAHTSGTIRAELAVENPTQDGIVRITDVLSSTVANVTVLAALASTDATKRWAEGAWSQEQGYPGSVGLFEDRIIYGGSSDNAQVVWLSATSDYEDFEEGVNADDSFSIMLTTTNDIRWIDSIENLLIGTSGDEWRISSNDIYTPLTPTTFSAKRQTTYGSADIQAIAVRDTVLFVDYVGRKIHEMTYSDMQGKYVAPDLTALAEHITEGGILSFAYQKNPDSIIWSIRDDGTLLSMTYDRDQNVVAWARHLLGTLDSPEEPGLTPPEEPDDLLDYTITVIASTVEALWLDDDYNQIEQVADPPWGNYVWSVHQSADGFYYMGDGLDDGTGPLAACVHPHKFDHQRNLIPCWPEYTDWETEATDYITSVRPTHDSAYVYVASTAGVSGWGRIVKLVADTGALVWTKDIGEDGMSWYTQDIGVLSNGNVIVPTWFLDVAAVNSYPAILSGVDGSVVSRYDGATSNVCVDQNCRVLVVESAGKWFTCGTTVDAGGDYVGHGCVHAYTIGTDEYLQKAWDFIPRTVAEGIPVLTIRGLIYKGGYVYAVGNRVPYTSAATGYAVVWRINAATGVCDKTYDLTIDGYDIFLKGDLTIVVAAYDDATIAFTELNDDLTVIAQYDRDVATWETMRAECVPEALLYPAAEDDDDTETEASPNGAVKSICVIPSATEDEIWLSVARTTDDGSIYYIERMAAREFETQADGVFVDSATVFDSDATDTFTGLDHLEGQTVSILGDGAVYPDQVVEDGTITLSAEVSKAIIGLPYRYTLKPMRLEVGTNQGSTHGTLRKIPTLVLSFQDTLNAKYGSDMDHLYDIEWRTEEVLGLPPALYTGDKIVTLDGGFDPEDPIYITGVEPLPCSVRAIIARMDVTGR